MASLKDLIVMGPARFLDRLYGNLEGNATSADKLKTARTINGTNFDGTTAITTSNWGTARTLTVGNTGKSVNGSGNISWSLSEIGAVAKAGDTMTGNLTGATKNSTWIGMTRRGAFRTETAASGGSAAAVVSMKTASGSWAIGNLADDNSLCFVFGTDANYNTDTNSTSIWCINTEGSFTGSASKLTTARTINGTSFDGTTNITTSTWGTARTFNISDSTNENSGGSVSINGSTNITLKMPSTFKMTKTQSIVIEGDANTYYPVVIGMSIRKDRPIEVSIHKNLGSQTPSSYEYNHESGTSSLWLLYEGRNGYWDGNGGFLKTLYKNQGYATLVSHAVLNSGYNGDLIVWLRGGGCYYEISTTVNTNITICYSETNLGSSTSPNYVAPRTDIGNGGIYSTTYYGYGNLSGDISGTASAVRDRTNGTATYLNYGASGLSTTSWFAAWNGYELRGISPTNSRITMSAMAAISANGYYGMGAPDGTTSAWIRTTLDGIIPYQSGGCSSLGTSGWPFNNIYSNKGYFGGTSTTSYALNTSSFICDSWVRTKGASGWYNESYGGGWYMEDSTYIRAYNSKKVYVSNDSMSAIYTAGAMRAVKGFTVDETMSIRPERSNEINFGGTNTSTVIYMGYRATDSRSIPTNFVFGGSGGSATITASYFTGTAENASKDASGNTITSSYLRRYAWWASSSSNNVDNLRAGVTFAYNLHNAPTTGTIVAFDCSDNGNYGLQIMGDYSHTINHLHFRNRNGDNNTWGEWRTILDNNNYTNYTVTKNGSGASGTSWGIGITGNAATATAFSSNRTIALTGDVTGSASTNGSSGWSISTTVADDSHNHIIGNVDGLQTALNNKAGGGNYIDITVGGNANTYYPVVLSDVSSYYPMQFVNISRTYSETAPDTWNNATHKGGLTMTLFWNGSRYWDGNSAGAACHCVYLNESYSIMVGGLGNSTTGIVVWLRGGTAIYHIHSLNGKTMTATVYTSTYTDSAGNSFAPTTTPATVTVEWPGDISGRAATASSATTATRAQYLQVTRKHYANSSYYSGRGNCFYIRQYVNTRSSSTSPTDCTYYEQYNLPRPTAGRSGNISYTILTSKSDVTVSQGGTGSSTAGASAGQALYNLGLIYSVTAPEEPTPGMVWLKPTV